MTTQLHPFVVLDVLANKNLLYPPAKMDNPGVFFYAQDEGPNGTLYILDIQGSTRQWRPVSGAGGSISGAAIKYVVYPPDFNNLPTNAFTSIQDAIDAANLENTGVRVPIIVMPGVYEENITLRDGIDLYGVCASSGGIDFLTVRSGVFLTPLVAGPAVTIPAGSNVGISNMNIDGGVLLEDNPGATQLVIESCNFTGAIVSALIDGSGGDVEAIVLIRNSAVNALSKAIELKGTSTVLSARDCTLLGLVEAQGTSLYGCVAGNVVSNVGLMTLDDSTASSVDAKGGLDARYSIVAGAVNIIGSSKMIFCSVQDGAVTLNSPIPSSHRMDYCTVNSPATGVTLGANDSATLNGCSIIPGNGIAVGGTGSLVVIGHLMGAGIVADTVTAIAGSLQMVLQNSNVSLTGGGSPDPWPTDNPDRVRCTPPTTTAADNIQELPDSAVQVPNRPIYVRNVSTTNFMTITVAAGSGDTLFDGSAAGDIVLPPGGFRMFVCNRGVGWEAN